MPPPEQLEKRLEVYVDNFLRAVKSEQRLMPTLLGLPERSFYGLHYRPLSVK
jgi:hypothetical protein